MRTHPLSRAALFVVMLALALPAARAHAAAARTDSTRAESAPAPMIRMPAAAAPATPAKLASPASEDTAIVNGRKRAKEQFGRGLMLEEQQAYSAAIISYANAARSDPTLRGPSYRIGLLFMSRQQYGPAMKAFREEMRRDPESVPNTMEYALALCELGDSTRSVRMLDDLTRKAPGNADVWRSLGFVQGRYGHYDAAEKALRGAIALKPRFAKAYRDLGVVLAARSRDREAREAYAKAIEYDPSDESALINLANLEARNGGHERALTLYAKAETVDSTQAYAYQGQVRELVTLGREAYAGAVWKRWLAASGGDPDVRDGTVRHYLRQDRNDIAMGIARDAVREHPRSGEAWWLLGDVYADGGELRSALDAYRKAWRAFAQPADKARADRSIAALRGVAPDSLRALFAADSVAALTDTTGVRRIK